MPAFDYISGGDWDGLFVDGKLVDEGHSISTFTALKIAKEYGPVETIEWHEADINWLEGLGSFPDNLDEVKFQ